MSTALFDLSGRTALVTGSSRGIGHALARGLAAAGARVVINGRDPDGVTSAVDALRAAGVDAHSHACDVTDPAAVDAMIEAVERDVAPLDIVVINAGITRRGPLHELDDESWRLVLDTNLSSAFYVARSAARRMIPRGRGKLITTCSLMSTQVRPGGGVYAATKGGLKMLTQAMCADWARYGIQANALGPGYFLTDLTQPLAADPTFDAWVKARTPAGRWGNVEELVGAAIFLASDASSYVNGHLLNVDGGTLAAL